MYSFEMTYDSEAGANNKLFDPEKGSATFGVMVVPLSSVAASYAAMSCNYKRRSSDPVNADQTRSFRLERPAFAKVASGNGGYTPMLEPHLSGAVDGAVYLVFVAEFPGDVIDGDGSWSPGAGPVSSQVLSSLIPNDPDGNAAPADGNTALGVALDGVNAVAMFATGGSGSTMSGGYLEAWLQAKGTTHWFRAPDLDLAFGTTGADGGLGDRAAWAARSVPIGAGRLFYQPQDVTLSIPAEEIFIQYMRNF